MGFTNKIVIDANTWLRYAIYKKHHKILYAIAKYQFEVFCNNYLLAEIFDACVSIAAFTPKEALYLVSEIEKIAVNFPSHAVYRLSPDPKDNYLFDLAIQNNCSYIISDDGLLQRMPLQPIPVKSTNWFLKHYPI